MPFVIDNSIVVAGILGEDDALAEACLAHLANTSAVAPSIWPAEFANALWSAERRQRLTAAQASQALAIGLALGIAVEDALPPAQVFGAVHSLARLTQLSVYDALYLELAMRRGLPLATLDTALARAADAVGVARWKP